MSESLHTALERAREASAPAPGAAERFQERILSRRRRVVRTWLLAILPVIFLALGTFAQAPTAAIATTHQLRGLVDAGIVPSRADLLAASSSVGSTPVPAFLIAAMVVFLITGFVVVVLSCRRPRSEP